MDARRNNLAAPVLIFAAWCSGLAWMLTHAF